MKSTIKIFVVIAIIATNVKLESSNALAKQMPYYTQYMYCDFFINPAVGGTNEGVPILMTFRL